MGKTSKSAGTKARATEVKKLTPRRIVMIKHFLKQTIDSPDNFGEFFRSEAWIRKLIETLREPKRCRSTAMDILAWLNDNCFQELIDQVIYSAAKRTGPRSEILGQPVNLQLVKSEPMSSSEDSDMQALLSLDQIKKEKIEDQDVFEHDGQTATGTGNQDKYGNWRVLSMKDETKMVIIKDESEEEPLLGIVKSELDDIKEENLDDYECLDLNYNRSAAAVYDELLNSECTNDVMEPDQPLWNVSPGYGVPDSLEEMPLLSPHTNFNDRFAFELTKPQSEEQREQVPNIVAFSHKESTDLVKKMTGRMIDIVEDQQWKDDTSKDWNSISLALNIVKSVLKNVK